MLKIVVDGLVLTHRTPFEHESHDVITIFIVIVEIFSKHERKYEVSQPEIQAS